MYATWVRSHAVCGWRSPRTCDDVLDEPKSPPHHRPMRPPIVNHRRYPARRIHPTSRGIAARQQVSRAPYAACQLVFPAHAAERAGSVGVSTESSPWVCPVDTPRSMSVGICDTQADTCERGQRYTGPARIKLWYARPRGSACSGSRGGRSSRSGSSRSLAQARLGGRRGRCWNT